MFQVIAQTAANADVGLVAMLGGLVVSLVAALIWVFKYVVDKISTKVDDVVKQLRSGRQQMKDIYEQIDRRMQGFEYKLDSLDQHVKQFQRRGV